MYKKFSIPLNKSIKDNLKINLNQVLVSFSIPMEISIQGNGNMISIMDKVSILGKMDKDIKDK